MTTLETKIRTRFWEYHRAHFVSVVQATTDFARVPEVSHPERYREFGLVKPDGYSSEGAGSTKEHMDLLVLDAGNIFGKEGQSGIGLVSMHG